MSTCFADRIRERGRRYVMLRQAWRIAWYLARHVWRTPSFLLGQLLYWRSFPYEVIGVRLMRKKYGRLYESPDEDPLVSVIIATYDRGKLLVERTLPSMLSQTYQNFEIVIVGDHSPEETVKWISSVNDPRVRFYNLPRRPKYPKDPIARWRVAGSAPSNKAFDLAHGKWLALSDDDEVWTPDHIEALLRFAQAGHYELVSGLYQQENVQCPGILEPTPYNLGVSTWLYRSYLRVFRCDIYSWRYDTSGDVSLHKRMLRSGVKMGSIDHVVAYHMLRPGETQLGSNAAIYNAKLEADLCDS